MFCVLANEIQTMVNLYTLFQSDWGDMWGLYICALQASKGSVERHARVEAHDNSSEVFYSISNVAFPVIEFRCVCAPVFGSEEKIWSTNAWSLQ